MKPTGTFHAVWVRSHEEDTVSDDAELTERRTALAIADRLAGTGHSARPDDSANDRIAWDLATLVDDDGRPVVGAVRPFLTAQAQPHRRGTWMRRTERKGQEYATVTSSANDTMAMLQWPDARMRFYWRVISSVLHTNVQKHRLVPEWPESCRHCPNGTRDTQAHRYGCTEPVCPVATTLAADISAAVHALCYRYWLPDQSTYIPGLGHELASATARATRRWWSTPAPGAVTTWRPMVNLQADMWIHACQLHLLVGDAEQYHYAAGLLVADLRDPPRFPGGQLLPTRLQLAVRQCAPGVAAVGLHPMQVTDVWATGSLAPQYEHHGTLRMRQPSPGAAQSWIDDIYRPHTQLWWNGVMRRYQASLDPAKMLWAACYEASPGWQAMMSHGCAWFVVIPSGSLRMRSSQDVVQTAPTSRGQLISRNPRAIGIGIVTAAVSHADTHRFRHIWRDVLQYDYDTEWMELEHVHHGRRGAGSLHDLALWNPAVTSAFPAPVSSLGGTWLHEHFPAVYAAPSGWRSWPSATPTTAAWALALSTSRRLSRLFHTGVLRAIWDANHAHWLRTCAANHTAIMTAGDAALLDDANEHIRRGVRGHQHFRFGLDTQLDAVATRQAQRTNEWRRATS